MLALLVALGGAAGTLLRFGLASAMPTPAPTGLPIPTLLVNVVGSLLLSIVATTLEGRTVLGCDARLVFGTGVLGGFTTYSTFNLETLRLIDRGAHGTAAAYVAATVLFSLAAGLVGLRVGAALR